jgi:hypothetical protein
VITPRFGTIAVSIGMLLMVPGVDAQSTPASIVGAWTLNTELSDPPPAAQSGEREGRGRSGGPGGSGGGGRRGGGGGFGGGGGRGGGGGGRGGGGNPEDLQRRREALRDIMRVPDRMTITRTESMVIITTGDGRTTRLATDGSKVKDESTGIERKTRWDRDQLVTEISGVQGGKITETYAVNPESHRLMVTVDAAGARGDAPSPRHRVYDLQPQ